MIQDEEVKDDAEIVEEAENGEMELKEVEEEDPNAKSADFKQWLNWTTA